MKSRTSEVSQSDPPTDNYQQQLRDTKSINETLHHEITSNRKGDITVESGLGWFHSITPSVSSDDMTSPISTSTQDNQTGRSPNSSQSETSSVVKQPNCQTEKDIVSNSGLKSNNDAPDPFGTVPGASQEKNRKCETAEKSSVTEKEKKQSERQKPSESLEFVFQKVSKNLRDRRVRELELKNQQCDGGGGGGGGHRERVVSGYGTSKVLEMTSDSSTSSTLSSDKNCPSNSLVQGNLSTGKQSRSESEDRRQQTETKNISTVLSEKMAADAATNLHAKLSGFTFKPRKMKPPVHNFSDGLVVSGESHRNLDTNTESRKSKQKLVSHDVSTSSLTDAEKNEKKNTGNQCVNLSEGGSRRKQVSSVSEVGDSRYEASSCSTLKELEKEKDESRKSVGRIKPSDDTEDQGQQPARVRVGDDTVINNPEPSKSGHSNSTVASSTLAKLSRFTFTCTTEPTTTARSKVEKSALKTDYAECSRAYSKVKRTLIDKVKGVLPPPTHHTPAQEHDQGMESPSKREDTAKRTKSTPPTNHSSSVKMVNDGPFDYQSTVNLKKRKCFALDPPPSSTGGFKGPFSGLSLFDSLDLSNDVLDTDWDQEVSKKAKV